MSTKSETIGWWGCLSCGDVVRNNHTGPCSACGGRIGRIVPRGVKLDTDMGLRPLYEPTRLPYVEPPKSHAGYIAIVAAAVLCIGSPLLGASTDGWNAVTTVMALNMWSFSIGYYALALLRNSDAESRVAVHA
jgi:hypothetical protein